MMRYPADVKKKRFILALVLALVLAGAPFLSPAAQAAGKVSSINFTGNERLAAAYLKSKITLSEGEVFSGDALDESIKALYRTGEFEDIKVEVSDGDEAAVLFTLEEKPILYKVDYKGFDKLKETDIEAEVNLFPGSPVGEREIQAASGRIKKLYKTKGYYNAAVTAVKEKKDSSVKIVFNIDEGKKIKIKKINVTGNKRFSGFNLKKFVMDTGSGDPYDAEKLAEDIEKIKAKYADKGYLMLKVSEPVVTFAEKGILIDFSIEEGASFRLGDVAVTGNREFRESDIRSLINMGRGEVFNRTKFGRIVNSLYLLYSKRGYIYDNGTRINFLPDFDMEKNIVNVSVDITEGSPVSVDKVVITGNVMTKDYVIRRELLFYPGEVYDGEKIMLSKQKLFQLGFFDEVNIEELPSENEGKRILSVSVKERRTGTASFGAGYSSVDSLVGYLEIQENNFFGYGQSANLKWEFGTKKTNYELGFTEPWLRNKPITAGVDIYDTTRNLQELYYYNERRRGVTLRLGTKIKNFNYLYSKYRYESTNITDIDRTSAPAQLADYFDNYGNREIPTSSVSLDFVRDTRDNSLYATKGYKFNLSQELAGGPFGGENHFYKSTLEGSYYLPTFWKFVLVMHAQAGIISSLGIKGYENAIIPDYEKFYLGGAYSVRGYREHSIATPTGGGNAQMFFNLEYKFPLVETLQGAFFFDGGGVWTKPGEMNFGSMKYGAGFGIRFDTPMGPIRLDYGIKLSDDVGHGEVHFNIGQSF